MKEIASGHAAAANARRGIRLRAAGVLAAIASLAAAGAVLAIDGVELHIDEVKGAAWLAEDVTLHVVLDAGATRANVRIARLTSVATTGELRDVRIECPDLETSVAAFACADARVAASAPGIGKQSFAASVRYGRRDGALDVALDGLRLAQGTADVSASMHEDGWRATVEIHHASIQPLLAVAQKFGAPVAALSAQAGVITLSATVRGVDDAVRQAKVDATLTGLTANNESGSLASDKLSFSVAADVRRAAGDWRFSFDLRSRQGQAYAQPIFLDLGAHTFALKASGSAGGRRVIFDNFSLDHADVATAQGRMALAFDHEQPLRLLDLQEMTLQFPGAYEAYFQPLLLDTNFKSMTTAGAVSGRVSLADGRPQHIDLTLHDLAFDDGERNFALGGLQGRWRWRADERSGLADADSTAADSAEADSIDAGETQDRTITVDSMLRWSGGTMLGLDLGASELRFATVGRQFRLLQPARIPVLDGAIELQRFRVRNAGAPDVSFLVDAVIEPVSVQRLCQAFGWPEFGGSIGGAISGLRMREGVVTLGTTLQAQVFDGLVRISDLRLEEPFGEWPRFEASIALENLDLELLTGAFSFGRITGRLSGAVNGLKLFNWTPIAFDARLHTPAGDRSRHRISQRAVENIGSIGGGGAGVAAALSSGFLRFFDEFTYDRLGISCRLENEVCHMGGVAPAPNGGYYLVKGAGLPRIDVIGSSRRVDWPRLVQQLIAATQSRGPVVE